MSHRRPRGGRTPNPHGQLDLPPHERRRGRGPRRPGHRLAGGVRRLRTRGSRPPRRDHARRHRDLPDPVRHHVRPTRSVPIPSDRDRHLGLRFLRRVTLVELLVAPVPRRAIANRREFLSSRRNLVDRTRIRGTSARPLDGVPERIRGCRGDPRNREQCDPRGCVRWQWPFLLWGGINLAAVAVGLSLSRGRPSPPHLASRSVSDYVGVLRDVRHWLLPLALVGAVFNIVAFFGPLLLNSKFGLPANVAGVAVALWILAGTVATFFFGRLSARFGRHRTLVASFAALGVATLVGGTIGNVWIVLVVMWTLGPGRVLTYSGLFVFVSESSHRRLQGAAFGLVFGFQLVGGAVRVFLADVR